jgi:thiosulfate dehydrogenase
VRWACSSLATWKNTSLCRRKISFAARLLIVASVCACWVAWGSADEIAYALKAPREETIPIGPLGEAIRLGKNIVSNTKQYAAAYTGNGLNCTSCHLGGGTVAYSSPWVGVWGVYPEYRSRNARVNTLEDRINDCFMRSMNGKALPLESNEMRAVLAYFWWMSKDVPVGVSVEGRGFKSMKQPAVIDPAHGRMVYAEKCAACHGATGEGLKSESGYLFPPLWGPDSFNIGAGMARVNTAAAFVKHNMPFGQGETLTDQDAYDVAEYFTMQPRPDFTDKAKDWPRGNKPADAPY